MSQALTDAARLANDWLDGLSERPVQANASLEELRARFSGPLPDLPSAPEDVISSLDRDMRDGLLGSAGGRFFAWVIGGGLESALAADWLVSTWDQNAALYACGPAVSVVEEVAGEWLKDLFDLPREASFGFTTGCQLAHMTSLAAARHAVLKRQGWDVEAEGLHGAPRLRVIVNDQKHGSIQQAVNYLGLGQRSLVPVETRGDGRIPPDSFAQVLSESDEATIVVLNAADLNIGACDDFEALIPIAKEAGAWVHVDGAFGLFARASARHRHLVRGLEHADSWATDGHKWLNVPFDCGIAIIRDRAAHKAAMTITAPYIAAGGAARDQIDWNPEWSRRARGVPVYAALRELGRSGVQDLVDRCCEHCAAIVAGIGALPEVEIVSEPTLNQGLLRFTQVGKTPEENDTYTDRVISEINDTGEAFFSGTTWQGRRAMRVSVVNWRTTEDDVRRAIEAATHVLGRHRKNGGQTTVSRFRKHGKPWSVPILLLLAISSPAAAAATSLTNPWADAREPVSGKPLAIGGYSAGCVQGAESILADEGSIFQVMRKSRRRYFAQPEMRNFIKKLASEIRHREFGTLLVGDLGQARGGPTTTGHASHQTGLDGDFWFWLDSPANHRTLTEQEVDQLSALSMLDQDQQGVDAKRFQAKHVSVLEYVSQQPEVARIFVHPLIKKAACEATDQAAWLNKLRPWWGHHYHFHVRLHCPAGQAACKPQSPPPASHGCGKELAWWFSEEAAEKLRKRSQAGRKLTPPQRLANKLARVPGQCKSLLQ